jgi:ribosomal protein S24E
VCSSDLGYLLYRLWPEQKVFIDGQTDFYGEKLTRDYAAIYDSQPGYEEVMQKYKVDWVIIQRTSQLALELDKKPNEWMKEYSDELSAIYIRK